MKSPFYAGNLRFTVHVPSSSQEVADEPSFLAAAQGDVNGFFGLLLDNLAALVLLFTLLVPAGYATGKFSGSFVLTWLIPGTVAGVLLNGVLYALLARLLARRTGRHDVTAMPVGLDTPSVFAMSLFVLLPALTEARTQLSGRNLDELALRNLASIYAWHVGAAVLVMLGLFKMLLAPFGNLLRRCLPQAALLGSLAGVSLALIAFLPMARYVAPAPVVGLPVLAIIFVTLLSQRGTHDRFPGTVLALGCGLALMLLSVALGDVRGLRGWFFAPMMNTRLYEMGHVLPFPAEVWGADWWHQVAWSAAGKLPIALPYALFTIVGGVECTESAAAAGDEYDSRSVLVDAGTGDHLFRLAGRRRPDDSLFRTSRL